MNDTVTQTAQREEKVKMWELMTREILSKLQESPFFYKRKLGQ